MLYRCSKSVHNSIVDSFIEHMMNQSEFKLDLLRIDDVEFQMSFYDLFHQN